MLSNDPQNQIGYGEQSCKIFLQETQLTPISFKIKVKYLLDPVF